jgi:uncharacterized protein with GYD domain
MAHYILLMKLTTEGRAKLAEDADSVVRAHDEVDSRDVTGLGMYGVLGAYDIVTIIEAEDNEAAARYSLRLGLKVGARIETLPAVPLTSFEPSDFWGTPAGEESVEMGLPRTEP